MLTDLLRSTGTVLLLMVAAATTVPNVAFALVQESQETEGVRTASNPDVRNPAAEAQQRSIQAPPAQTPAEENYRNQILDYWQASSAKIKNYKCTFRRYTFDTGIVNHRDAKSQQLSAAEIAIGTIFFAAPQHGRYETDQVWSFAAPPKKPGEEADYKLEEGDSVKTKWICDGRMIYEFDYEQKRLYDTEIPEHMQGPEGLSASPIPFLFGAKRDVLLERYWVRVVPRPGTKGEYWLEVFPKRAQDARNYSKVEIIISEDDFLPKAMRLFSPQFDPSKGNFASMQFEFYDRKVNALTLEGLFGRPSKPIGWTRQPRSFLAE